MTGRTGSEEIGRRHFNFKKGASAMTVVEKYVKAIKNAANAAFFLFH